MRLRMLESVTRVRGLQVRGGRIYLEPCALEAGDIYELSPDYAQMLMSSGKAVTVEGPPLPLSVASGSHQNVRLW
jgi:hypothetical protein